MCFEGFGRLPSAWFSLVCVSASFEGSGRLPLAWFSASLVAQIVEQGGSDCSIFVAGLARPVSSSASYIEVLVIVSVK